MSEHYQSFLADAEKKAFDVDHRKKIKYNISKYLETVEKGVLQYSDLELVKKRAKNIKWKAIENLDKKLVDFEANFTARGGHVIWADNTEEALSEIMKILEKSKVKSVVKSKSMATEEIHLNDALEDKGIEVLETDLGEYIQQLDGEPPYHILTPAMHKSREDVAQLFNKEFGTPVDLSSRDLTLVARKALREKFVNADAGISGANFLICDTGSIAITENEGNGRLTTSFPKIHIVIAGIEKIIPSIKDLSLFWPLLSTLGTGQKVTVFNSIISGPKLESEVDGPEEMYVVLLNNGRTNLLAEPDQRQALYCIRCGACLNSCPIYKNIGGHTYGTTYSGPIGSIITPHFRGMEQFKHLSYASSLCGKCSEVCPVNIDLHKMLLYNRRDMVKEKLSSTSEKWGFYLWRKVMQHRGLMDFASSKIKNILLKRYFGKSWGKRKSLPKVAKRSFSSQWKKNKHYGK